MKAKLVLVAIIPACFGLLRAFSATLPSEQDGQVFRVQCPSAIRHTDQTVTCGTGTLLSKHLDRTEAPCTGPGVRTDMQSPGGHTVHGLTFIDGRGMIKCRQTSGGDGYMTEADGSQTLLLSFGPRSGLYTTQNAQKGMQFPARPHNNSGQPNRYCNSQVGSYDPNGALGYVPPGTGTTVPGSVGIDAATPGPQQFFTTPDGRDAMPGSMPSQLANSLLVLTRRKDL
jgi:hypothetical protein